MKLWSKCIAAVACLLALSASTSLAQEKKPAPKVEAPPISVGGVGAPELVRVVSSQFVKWDDDNDGYRVTAKTATTLLTLECKVHATTSADTVGNQETFNYEAFSFTNCGNTKPGLYLGFRVIRYDGMSLCSSKPLHTLDAALKPCMVVESGTYKLIGDFRIISETALPPQKKGAKQP
jgi:hypothetical protein